MPTIRNRFLSDPILREKEFHRLIQNAKQLVTVDGNTKYSDVLKIGENDAAFGEYELLEKVAHGGMGVVYKARHKKLDRVCALKMIRAGQLASDEEVLRFYSEAEAAASLNHPGIVPVYDVGQVGERHFFSMAFVEGTSLADELRDGPLEPGHAAKLTKQIAEAIAYAHERDVIHRDLKPANILLDQNGRPMITDFGLAKKTKGDSNLTATGQILGTPSFMPPEQASGKLEDVDKRSDVYSLGAMLYTLLTARPPFQAASQMDTLIQVLNQEPLPPSKLAPKIPRDLETICLKCLQKDARRRYSSGEELADDLGRWLTNTPIVARRVSLFEKAWLWCRRNPRLVGATLVTFFVLAAIVFYAYCWRQASVADELVRSLLNADTARVEAISHQLAKHKTWASDDLQQTFNESSEGSNEKLHSAMGLLKLDASNVQARNHLADELLNVTPFQFKFVRDSMADHRDWWLERYWEIAADKENERRFQAACALATFDPENAAWQKDEFCRFVTGYVVSVLPSELQPWREALKPVKHHLTESLMAIYRDPNNDAQVRGFATDILANYFQDDAETLFELLKDANEKDFEQFFNRVLAFEERAIELGIEEVTKPPNSESTGATQETVAMRQANAAIMLLRLNNADTVWPLLRSGPDPSIRSYIIHWFRPRNGDAAIIINRYRRETDNSIKRALLHCLGEFNLAEDEKQSMIEMLLNDYRSEPDAGLHGAAEWLLRQWNQQEKISEVDKVLSQTIASLNSDDTNGKQWYVNSQGQTYSVIDADEFMMGSPATEDGHQQDEQLHRCRIGRQIAIGTKEVTKGQWRDFSNDTGVLPLDQEKFRDYIPHDDCPMVGMTWCEATHYCNWLSEREGIPKSQWCYEPNGNGEFAPGMKAKPKFWELSGYRLPTEAEWEFACRAGSGTSRYYGNADTLLTNYAWYLDNGVRQTHVVGSLKPNDFGLFDMHGNVYNWVFDCYGKYTAAETVLSTDINFKLSVDETDRRVMRSGAFRIRPDDVRSAFRNHDQPIGPHMDVGFRCVRTCKPIRAPNGNRHGVN